MIKLPMPKCFVEDYKGFQCGDEDKDGTNVDDDQGVDDIDSDVRND